MNMNEAIEAAKAIERGERPPDVVLKLTGTNSLSSPGPGKPQHLYVFTRVDPFIEAGSGERYYYRIDDDPQEYYVECWATENGNGQDHYKVMSDREMRGDEAVTPQVTEEEFEEFEQQLSAFQEDWWNLWRQYVEPQIGRAQRDAIKRMQRRHEKWSKQ